MNIFILILNILVPLSMILIGLVYLCNSYKKLYKIFELCVPVVMFFSGISNHELTTKGSERTLTSDTSKKCGYIWIISGVILLIVTLFIILVNNNSILMATTILDISNVSVIMLEVELAIFILIYIYIKRLIIKGCS